MNIQEIEIKNLKPYEKNPRKNLDAVQYVANSIKEFGFKVPIVIDKDNTIVAGHTRYLACIKLGIEKVPCVIADDLTEEQIKAFRLADNKVSEKSGWDFDLLGDELLSIDNIDMTQFDFDLELFKEEPEANEDNFNVGDSLDKIEEPKTKYGDIYQLGNHRLMCGDSTKRICVDLLMNNNKADLIVTDPPYNVDYEDAQKNLAKFRPNKRVLDGRNIDIKNDKMSDNEFYNFLLKVFANLYDNVKDGGSIYVFHADSEGLNFRKSFTDAGFKLAQCLIWVKNNFTLGRQDYQWKHEPILYGWKEGQAHYYIDDRTQSTILEFSKPMKSGDHPTMKPIDLLAYLITNSSKQGESVLDTFGGSGSTLIACEQLNRNCYMMELDPKYCDVIINRWETLTGNKAEFIENVAEQIASEPEESIEDIVENARIRTINTYNLEEFNEMLAEGEYEMPIIQNDEYIPTRLIGFNYLLNSKDKETGIHCFVDDYQFERLWNRPYDYIDKIKEYECFLSPDFSLYMNMPMAMKIWNVYRSRLLGQFYQRNGAKVIPTISWAEKETYKFCFDGIPKGSIVAISTIGVKQNDESLEIWKDGVTEMIKRIEPSTILVYGGKIDYDYGDINVVYYDNEVTERMKLLKN